MHYALVTLAKVNKAIRDAPSEWTSDHSTGHPTDIGVVLALLEALWKAQDDRHGGQPDFAEVTQVAVTGSGEDRNGF